MINLYNRPEPIDIITVKDELLSIGKFDVVGGLEYLADLPEKVPTTANLVEFLLLAFLSYLSYLFYKINCILISVIIKYNIKKSSSTPVTI